MRKTALTLILTAVLILFALVPAAAAQSERIPEGVCPAGFDQHMVEDHEAHDHHIGLTVDLNQNDYVCVKHLPRGLHVHVDDVVRP